MARWLALVPVLGLVACFSYQDVEELDGWEDVRLGITVDELGPHEIVKDEGIGEVEVRRLQEPSMWGPAPVGGIRYLFWDGHLWKIEVRTGDSKGFLSAMTRRFGTPPFSTPWQWEGETVRMNFMGTEYDTSARIFVVKKPLEAEREAERPERLATAAEAEAIQRAAARVAREAAKVEAQLREQDHAEEADADAR